MNDVDPIPQYLEHLRARLRKREGRATAADRESGIAVLPAAISALSTAHPTRCLELIVRTLEGAPVPQEIAAIGDGLLQDLLNDSAGRIADQVSAELRKNKRFRQAFGFVNYASVDTAVIEDWVEVLTRLGTTKEKERKSTWRRPKPDPS